MKTFTSFREATMKNDPCWKGYQMIGKKKKNGKEVPNCVPKEETQINELFGLGKKKPEPLTPEQHLKHLSDAAHSASDSAHSYSEDAYRGEPDTDFLDRNYNSKGRTHAKQMSIHNKLYANSEYTADPEQVYREHVDACKQHERAGAAHAAAAAEAFKQGDTNLAREHLEHAKKHSHHSDDHHNEGVRIDSHYEW
jgi:hypothetical protein